MAVRFEPQAGRGTVRIREYRRAFRNHGLALVDFRHGPGEAAKTFLNFTDDIFVEVQFAAEQIGDRGAGAVIVGGAEAAGSHDDFSARHRLAEGGMHFGWRITYDRFMNYANAEAIQGVGEPK